MAALPVSELIWLAFTLAAAGIVMGLFAGLFGVGGGAIVIPVLYEVFRIAGVPDEVRMPLCVGTSLAIIIPTSVASFRSHNARGAADLSVLKRWALPVIAGVLIASAVARHAPEALFKIVFVAIAGFSAFRLLFHPDGWRFADEMPGRALMSVYGLIIGALSALMGIGGGQIANLFMTFHGRSIHQAIATSSGLGALIAVPATLGYIYAGWPRAAEFPNVAALQFPFALGYVSLIGTLLVVPTSTLVAPLGARLAHRLTKRQLEIGFGLFLLAVSLRFLVSLLGR
jgi:uncharacterized membrane protein YfcA